MMVGIVRRSPIDIAEMHGFRTVATRGAMLAMQRHEPLAEVRPVVVMTASRGYLPHHGTIKQHETTDDDGGEAMKVLRVMSRRYCGGCSADDVHHPATVSSWRAFSSNVSRSLPGGNSRACALLFLASTIRRLSKEVVCLKRRRLITC